MRFTIYSLNRSIIFEIKHHYLKNKFNSAQILKKLLQQ